MNYAIDQEMIATCSLLIYSLFFSLKFFFFSFLVFKI